MARLIKIGLVLIFFCAALPSFAWKPWPLPMDSVDTHLDTIFYSGAVQAVTSSGTYAPFWFQTNQNGSVSSQPHSGNLSLAVGKEATRPNRWYDYSFGVEAIGQVDTKKTSLFFQQLYGHVRLYVFDITIGIKPEIWGNHDEFLSSGGFLWI